MTAIAAVAHQGKVWIGGDSAGTAENLDQRPRADPKVFTVGPFVMGFTSSFRMGQLLRYNLQVPAHPEGADAHRYMATLFIDAVRDCLTAGGWSYRDHEREFGGTFLVGYRGRIFTVGDDYQVGEPADSFDAVGIGDNQALGALYATMGKAPRKRLTVALEAAERFSAGVRAPFTIIREP